MMSIPGSFMLPLPYHAILNSFISVAGPVADDDDDVEAILSLQAKIILSATDGEYCHIRETQQHNTAQETTQGEVVGH